VAKRVLIFGATGMVGQGVLRECARDSSITEVVAIGRTPVESSNPKIRNIVHKDLYEYKSIRESLSGFEACFFCLGTPSAGKSEAEYKQVTYDIPVAAAAALVELNPHMTFVFVSGSGADSTEKGIGMWARVKGMTENALLKIPFKAVYVIRPGMIQPLDGIQSKTKMYRVIYNILAPVLPLFRRLVPSYVTSTRLIGRAMIHLMNEGFDKKILTNSDLLVLTGGAD
jgi:uncharacterized protein YbjT (DUF2867 family)